MLLRFLIRNVAYFFIQIWRGGQGREDITLPLYTATTAKTNVFITQILPLNLRQASYLGTG